MGAPDTLGALGAPDTLGALGALDALDALDALGKRFDTSDPPKASTCAGLRWSALIR